MKTAVAMLALAAAGLTASAANADTIATFADPSPSGATPMFAFNGSALTGSWMAMPNLNLLTPVLPTPDYMNAQFSMAPVPVLSPAGPTSFNMGPGSINFFDSFNVPILTIAFSGGLLNSAATFGSSDFIGQNVTFSGSLLGGNTVSNEAFAFSFANPVGTLSNYTVTSSFTSSATIPTPGAAALLGLGGLALGRRRR
jgi:MYXO-CTERM domain-containing protein